MRLLLVDDEKVMRESLKAMIDWKRLGYELYEASNGAEAIKILKDTNIDLILLDVTMPLVSGFGVLDWIKQQQYDCVATLLTCHDEFDYVKKAIQYDCFDYVMKDELDKTKIVELLNAMKQKLSKEKLNASITLEAQMLKKEKERENFQDQIQFLLTTRESVPGEFEKTFRKYIAIDTDQYRYVSIFINIQSYLQVINRYTEKNVVQFSGILDSIFKELLEDKDYLYCEMDHGQCYILLWFRHSLVISDIIMSMRTITEKIYSSFYHVLGMETSIMYTLPYTSLDECNRYYHLSRKCAQRSFVESLNGIHCIDDYEMSAKETSAFLQHFESSLSEAIHSRSRSQIQLALDNAEQTIKENQLVIDPKDIIAVLQKCAHEADSVTMSDPALQNSIHYAQMKDIYLELLSPSCIEENHQDKNLTVKKAMLIIQSRYQEDLGLEEIARELNMNASYLSRIFSKEMNESLIGYLNKYRVEKAKLLIRTSNYKLYEIAEKTGFTSSIVFSTTFKRIAGQTPTEYKNQVF